MGGEKKPLRELRRLNTLVLREKTFGGEKKAPAGTATPQHPGFKIKTHFLGEKKAPAGMGTPQPVSYTHLTLPTIA